MMYFTLGLFLSTLIGLSGVFDQRPVFDPDDHTAPTFADDKPRIDRFARGLKEDIVNREAVQLKKAPTSPCGRGRA